MNKVKHSQSHQTLEEQSGSSNLPSSPDKRSLDLKMAEALTQYDQSRITSTAHLLDTAVASNQNTLALQS
jgi:hypothetical protein